MSSGCHVLKKREIKIVKFTSPSQAIQMAIADAIKAIFQIAIAPRGISITACYPKYAAHYTSAIALAISQRLSAKAINIAEAIAQACSQNPEISSQWQLQAFGKGWLNIVLSDQYILTNLLALESWQPYGMNYDQGFWHKGNITNHTQASEPVLQYAYARCCALIRLAYREKLLLPSALIDSSIIASAIFTEPSEIGLYLQNLAIAEFLDCEQQASLVSDHGLSRSQLSRALAKSFLDFYDRCRIFGVNRGIALRRLLLIRITQKLLLAIAPTDINYTMYL